MSSFLRRIFGCRRKASPCEGLPPIREELFSVERLEEHGRSLAEAQAVTPRLIRGHPLVGRLADNTSVLLDAYRELVTAIDDGRSISPAAEWLIDNYHLVERQIREIRADLPPGFYRQLPKLAEGPFAGYPRVFGLAWGFVAHTDSRFDSEMLCRYVLAYQQVQPLTIGELWALAITLKIVLIENLRRLAEVIVANRLARSQADGLADRLLGAAEPLPVVLADQKRRPFSHAFAVQLLHRLRDQDPRITPALTMLDERLAAQGTSADVVVREVHRRQGASNVTVRNIITSLRLISDVDWTVFFERISLVNLELAGHQGFGDMDFPTRNLYRSAIEELAQGSKRTELEVTRLAVQAAGSGQDERRRDPGYHLLNGGRPAFEAEIGFHVPFRLLLRRLSGRLGIGGYGAAVVVVTACVLAAPLLLLAHTEIGWEWLCLLGALGAIPAVDAAVALVNRAVTSGFRATLLPAMELRDGVPPHLRTMVVVPMMLSSADGVAEQVERLEIHHLASLGGDLHFALLSDWTDAGTEQAEGDQALLAAAADGIARLNARYGPLPSGARFLLLHRRRQWNPGEGRWIGWERKRGKLHELNRLLRGAVDTSFISPDEQPIRVPPDVRYVVTLDADARLPRDTVRRLIGKMAHPLNRARFDETVGRVTEGYAVLQPRVTPSLPVGREGSLFQRIFSSLSGIDPYSSAISDVYQDLFGEGSYAGKGIYDVDAFEASLAGRVPESTLLSHDLFEGVFARAGLATDVEVVEEFPARYDVCALRNHRWARGDWQLLPWILGRGPREAAAAPGVKAIPAIGRWKMIDNLRRTLSAPMAVLALTAGWLLPLGHALVWTAFVLSTIILPALLPVMAAIRPCRREVSLDSHLRALAGDLWLAASLSALIITFLAHHAWLMCDAIGRTLWRLSVSRRHLLEWVPAAQAAQAERLDLGGFYRRMAGAVLLGLLAVAAAATDGQGGWPPALAFASLWWASPAVARWASRSPPLAEGMSISEAEAVILRRTARRTWRFFETFVTPADHMLPPDNFQETPVPVIAHRTSPTNLGLYLLSLVCARDFGWIGANELVERLETTLATMEGMERFNGHFFNWYDTTDLRALDPKYVSSVDSGNLAGHLIALANACRDLQDAEPDMETCLAGIADAIGLLREEAAGLRDERQTQTAILRQLDGVLARLAAMARQQSGGGRKLLAEMAEGAEIAVDIANALAMEREDVPGADILFWAEAVMNAIASHRRDQQDGVGAPASRLEAVACRARSLAMGMQFGFLLDKERMLLSIGYLAPEGILDTNCYDLLASEARLASFFAIAKGDVPARHWFRLGRAVTPVAHKATLISWSGSMFEYLMPSLIMRAPSASLIEQTTRLAVRRQIEYATGLNLPWGISESAFNARDLEFTYQYSNFGVPGLGLKRGLGENLVIAPYATALAAMVDPVAASTNLSRLAAVGGRGRHGFYEALDYTSARVPVGEVNAVVRAFMAHHQGMTIIAIANALFDGRMRARFHAEPLVQATELLLQERMPRDVSVAHAWAAEVRSDTADEDSVPSGGRRFSSANQVTPAAHLLSNGRFSTMLTTAGSGYSRWGSVAVTRWREDSTCDDCGSYIFLRDVRSGEVWSAGFQPCGVEPDACNVTFTEDRAEFVRRDGTLATALEVLISPEDDAEIRRVSISNTGSRVRELEITSYAELVLTAQSADISHPAFYKLFVETEHLADLGAIVATRRRRAPSEPEVWAAHLAVVDGETVGPCEIETDRVRFLGRGRDIRNPSAMADGRPLSNTVGHVLDPIFALRRRVRIAPGGAVHLAFWTMVASTRKGILDSIDRHRDATAFGRAATLAWTQAQVQLHHLGVSAGEAGLFQRLAGHVIHAAPLLRPISDTIRRGAGPQPGLWGLGISGDLPIVFLRIADMEYLDIVRDLLQAHEYWRMKQLAVDLVILNEHQSSYVQDLHVALETLARTSQSRTPDGGDGPKGRVFVLRTALVPAETQSLLASVARIVLVAQRGTLSEQLDWVGRYAVTPPQAGTRRGSVAPPPQMAPPLPALEFFNGLGGFAAGGREYVTILGPGQWTPTPWINVVANSEFGFQVPTEGGGFTWSANSHENQITPWSNDPVSDRPGEVLYLRDAETGEVWCPTALPIRDEAATYVARHGWGYSRFEHGAHGIDSELVQYVPTNGSIKISRLTLRNRSGRSRRLGVTAYVEWVLGASRSASLPFVITDMDEETGSMFARNPWNAAFGARVAFMDLGGRQTEWTGDRREFIGRNGTLAAPLALAGAARLSNRVGAGLDPCGAMRAGVELPPGGSVEIVFFLGQAASADEARSLILHYRAADLDAVLAEVGRHWDGVLGKIQVKTPDRSMDVMLNGRLLYQTLVCRFWARSGFYQGSGAYGFRDQLQDGMALAGSCPGLVREHLLRAASRQFVEGDVQHWWLPHSGLGVRTRISDDRVWLGHAVAHYVDAVGDTEILDVVVPFLEGEKLVEGVHDSFFLPTVSDKAAPLFEHCARGLDNSLASGVHGLPLMGGGDWNDGMNRVGEGGAGESVWLGWLLHATLTAFIPLAEARGQVERAQRWRSHAALLLASLEREAWDGDWYRRGYFDDGTPLGTAAAQECRIDSIAQSWAVLSGAADPGRARQAMAAVERELIRPRDGVALLFAPPFDKTMLEPGYIKGYPPGIRENGGQYTHAALWSVMAFAAMGEGDKAAQLFSLLNPVNHALTRAAVLRYKVEPYVVAADVYAKPPHVGRGGWTWYTGSAGWMHRAGIEGILGLTLHGGMLHVAPCIPKHWPGFEVVLRQGSARYEIQVENPHGVERGIALATLDDVSMAERPLHFHLVDDGVTHRIRVVLG